MFSLAAIEERITAMNVTIHLTDVPAAAIREAIVSQLAAYNIQRAGASNHRPLVLAIEDGNRQVLGGLWGRTAFGWLFVELLFVPESLRGNGIGTELMLRAEREAVARGCHNAWLDTFEFQARDFYERLGYSRFGQLADFPAGYSRYFMKKVITDGVPSG